MHHSEILVPTHYDSEKERIQTELKALGVAAMVGVNSELDTTTVRVTNPDDTKIVELIAPEAEARFTGKIQAQ